MPEGYTDCTGIPVVPTPEPIPTVASTVAPESRFWRLIAYASAAVTISVVVAFIGGLWWNSQRDHLLNLRWEQDDAGRHENIVERLDRMETKLDYLIGADDARER